MQSDSLFYEIFQTAPHVFFELIGTSIPQSGLYSMVSQEVKQTRFQIDGILLPHHRRADLPIYFLEVMGYRPEQGKHFYQQLITEIHLYLNDYQPANNWRAAIIYTKRSYDPGFPIQLSEYATGDRVQRLYLDRLPRSMKSSSLEVSAIRLMGAKNDEAMEQAIRLVERTRSEVTDAMNRQRILELIQTICVYKFSNLSRSEIEIMLGLNELKQTRVYQEAKNEGREEMLEVAVLAFVDMGLPLGQIAERLKTDEATIERILRQNHQQGS